MELSCGVSGSSGLGSKGTEADVSMYASLDAHHAAAPPPPLLPHQMLLHIADVEGRGTDLLVRRNIKSRFKTC